MNWINEALQPEHPERCDLCVRMAREIADRAVMFAILVHLPCGSVTPVAIHNFQMN